MVHLLSLLLPLDRKYWNYKRNNRDILCLSVEDQAKVQPEAYLVLWRAIYQCRGSRVSLHEHNVNSDQQRNGQHSHKMTTCGIYHLLVYPYHQTLNITYFTRGKKSYQQLSPKCLCYLISEYLQGTKHLALKNTTFLLFWQQQQQMTLKPSWSIIFKLTAVMERMKDLQSQI